MIKKHKISLIITSLLVFLPSVAGLIMWDKLPESFIIHWNVSGEPDGYCGKNFFIFGMPFIMLALQWLCVICATLDKKNKNQNPKLQEIVLWIIPCLQWIIFGVSLLATRGEKLKINVILMVFFGILFMLTGNYMPKCRQNHTMGIKIKWTLENEENWNATHRFAGMVWFVCGFITLVCAFLPPEISFTVFIAVMIVAVIAPVIYSYRFSRKN